MSKSISNQFKIISLITSILAISAVILLRRRKTEKKSPTSRLVDDHIMGGDHDIDTNKIPTLPRSDKSIDLSSENNIDIADMEIETQHTLAPQLKKKVKDLDALPIAELVAPPDVEPWWEEGQTLDVMT